LGKRAVDSFRTRGYLHTWRLKKGKSAMRKKLIVLGIVMIFLVTLGCQKKHPVKVRVSPRMKSGAITTIAVFPFTSSVHETDDPDNLAPRMIQKSFLVELDKRADYKFVAPQTISFAVERQGLEKANAEFLKQWPNSQKPDMAFLKSLAQVLKCDAFLIGTVDLWQKDEVDFQENASPATYVGATITVLDAVSGDVLFQASDENYLEGLRSETTDRQLVVGASGNVYKDLDANTFKAPPFEDVVPRVVKALASSLPRR
jgi:hypothetical protein